MGSRGIINVPRRPRDGVARTLGGFSYAVTLSAPRRDNREFPVSEGAGNAVSYLSRLAAEEGTAELDSFAKEEDAGRLGSNGARLAYPNELPEFAPLIAREAHV